MIKDTLNLIVFVVKTHRKQFIVMSSIYFALIAISLMKFSKSHLFFWDMSGIIISAGFALILFIYSAYLGHLFKIKRKANYLSILPFSNKAIAWAPHVLLFAFAVVTYFPLKSLWDETHLLMGVSEITFLFFIPYVIYNCLNKIESQWAGVLTAFVSLFLLSFFWIIFFRIWNIYQSGIVTEMSYLAGISIILLIVERKLDSVVPATILMAAFIVGKITYDYVVTPSSYPQSLARMQFFPHSHSQNQFKSYVLSEENWKDYVIAPSGYQRIYAKFSRHYIESYWETPDKILFLEIMKNNFKFDYKNNRHYHYYSFDKYPIHQYPITNEAPITKGKLTPLTCHFFPLPRNKEELDVLFDNPKCLREKLLSDEIRWLIHTTPDSQILKNMLAELKSGRGQSDENIAWGVSTLFELYGRINFKPKGESRTWYKDSSIEEKDVERLKEFIFHDGKQFMAKFEPATKIEKLGLLDSLDFSSDETRKKSWKILKFLNRHYTDKWPDLPRWEEKTCLLNIFISHFKAKKYPEEYYYWMVNEVKKQVHGSHK